MSAEPPRRRPPSRRVAVRRAAVRRAAQAAVRRAAGSCPPSRRVAVRRAAASCPPSRRVAVRRAAVRRAAVRRAAASAEPPSRTVAVGPATPAGPRPAVRRPRPRSCPGSPSVGPASAELPGRWPSRAWGAWVGSGGREQEITWRGAPVAVRAPGFRRALGWASREGVEPGSDPVRRAWGGSEVEPGSGVRVEPGSAEVRAGLRLRVEPGSGARVEPGLSGGFGGVERGSGAGWWVVDRGGGVTEFGRGVARSYRLLVLCYQCR